MNFNKVILIGNLTRDPQLSHLPSGTPVCEFGLAINRRWKSSDGQQREETCFIDCRCYGKSAETFNQYMTKGRPVLVEGRLQFDTWEAQDGQKRSKHRVNVQNFQFLEQRSDSGQQAKPAPGKPPQAAAVPPAERGPPPVPGDDIPFS